MIWLKLVPRWAYFALGGVAVCTVLLLIYRAQLQKAESRGYDQAVVEAAQAAAAASAAYQAQVDAAEKRLAASRDARRKAVQTAKAETHAYYKANPSAAGVVCLPDERVQTQTQARARIHSSATSGGRDPL